VLLAAFVAWEIRFGQPEFIERVEAGLAVAVAQREAPPDAEITAQASAHEIALTVIGVPSPADQTRLMFAIARAQASSEWQPVAISFGSFVEPGGFPPGPEDAPPAGDREGEDGESSAAEPPRAVRIDRVVYVVDGQVATYR